MTLSADADILTTVDLFGKSVEDLQENVEVGAKSIKGTLKYVTGYTGFSSNVEEQSGNYLAIHVDTGSITADSITVMLIGGTVGTPKPLDNDGLAVVRIKDPVNQMLQFVARKDGETVVRLFDLSGLTLEGES